MSAGQTSINAHPVYGRMFQTPFSDRIRNETGMATMAVGNIFEPDHVNSILMAGRADLVCLARPHLADPYWTLHAAAKLGDRGETWPQPYYRRPRSTLSAFRRRRAGANGGMTMSLTGKHALVTGGGSGIGAAVAVALADAGAASPFAGGAKSRSMRPPNEPQDHSCRSRRCHRSGIDRRTLQAAQSARHFDIVVANAGSAQSAPAEKVSAELWTKTLDVNLTGAFFSVQPAIAGMRERQWGRIVFIASTAGLKRYPYVAPYVAAKHGVVGLARALGARDREGRHHRQCRLPRLTPKRRCSTKPSSALSRRQSAARPTRARCWPPIIRRDAFTQPQEVADAVLWLCAEGSAGITGQAISVSGGETW